MDAVMTRSPSNENIADLTTSLCPTRDLCLLPVLEHQSPAVPSHEAVTIRLESGEKTADFTSSPCPESTWRHSPVEALQTLAQPSSAAPVIRLPSDENSPDSTAALPASSQISFPVSGHQSLPSPSSETVSKTSPSGEKVADWTCPPNCATSIFLQSPFCRYQIRAVPSKEAVRQSSGVCTRYTVSPSQMPASLRVVRSSRTCDWKTK
mmetsp:Transcript_70836/g.125071  ORF Transcript_70836/g.125071 Transcript_70836/m.125071 type:complete len:208 (-) Transcript_70836:402-1025(-)